MDNSQLEGFLKAAKAHGPREHAMFLFAVAHGARASEICNLRIADLNVRSEQVRITRLKGSLDSTQTLLTREGLDSVQRERRAQGVVGRAKARCDDFVFNSQKATRLSRITVYKLFRAIARAEGLDFFSTERDQLPKTRISNWPDPFAGTNKRCVLKSRAIVFAPARVGIRRNAGSQGKGHAASFVSREYPRPRSVWISLTGSSQSIFRRSSRINASSVFSSTVGTEPHTAVKIVSRVETRPKFRIKTSSSINSVVVRAIARLPRKARRAVVSKTRSATFSTEEFDADDRRARARRRANKTSRANGFVR
jgi:type 1 fimbriae regulatory protein FimB